MSARPASLIHLSTLVAVGCWTIWDLRLDELTFAIKACYGAPETFLQPWIDTPLRARLILLHGLLASAAISLACWLAGLVRVRATKGARSIASLLALTVVIALWCSVFVHQSELNWLGKRLHLTRQTTKMEKLVAPLRKRWPKQDGELAGIGPFMAYPIGNPSTLILLGTPAIGKETTRIRAIERRDDGSLQLQLSAFGHDEWLQWHPEGSVPESFVGGLGDQHELSACDRLSDGWYLARYGDAQGHITQ